MPALYIITGSNGAGKSSLGPDYLPSRLRPSVFDGDKLYLQKRRALWEQGMRSDKERKRLADDLVESTFDNLVATALKTRSHFAYEGHFTTDATWEIPKRFKTAGYIIHLLFFGLKDTTLSQTRVLARATEGGHNVDPPTIHSNFYGNLEKLDQYFPIFDSVTIIDTSLSQPVVLALLEQGTYISAVPSLDLPNWFTTGLPRITDIIVEAENKGMGAL